MLLAALRIAVTRWRGDGDLLVDVERHGREGELDLSRTVGWLTSVQPVRLPATATTPEAVARALAAAPDHGIGYGMLRHLNAQAAPLLAQLPPAQVLFNYFGRFPAARHEDWAPAPEADALDLLPDPGMGTSHVLALDTMCAQTPDGPRLRATWTWTGLDEADVRAIADAWLAALRELAGAHDRLLDHLRTLAGQPVEDVWPLSPLQEGLFFHAGYDTAGLDVYTAQSAMDFAERLDLDRLAGRVRDAARPQPQPARGVHQRRRARAGPVRRRRAGAAHRGGRPRRRAGRARAGPRADGRRPRPAVRPRRPAAVPDARDPLRRTAPTGSSPATT